MDQDLPFQSSASVSVDPEDARYEPAATQCVDVVQETAGRTTVFAPAGRASVVADQDLPFQESDSPMSRETVLTSTTATQASPDVHDTPAMWLKIVRRGVGAGWTDQTLPFQRTGSLTPVIPCTVCPVAMHAVAVGQEMPSRTSSAPAPNGLGTL